MDTEAIVSSALGQLGLVAQSSPQGMAFIDLVIDPGGADVSVALKRRSLVTDDVARKLLAEHPPEGLALLVVGDRVTERARNLLRAEGTGFYDLRGHIALRRGPMVIDADVEPIGERSARSDALSGKAGLEVATELLLHPRKPAAIRQIARDLHRSPSTISDIVGALRRDGLIDHEGTATDGRLFWLVADRWTKPRTYLARLPGSETPAEAGDPLSLGLRNVADASGWALTGTTAAAAYGAPVAARSGQAVEFFVPERTTIRRATTLLGSAPSMSVAACTVRVAPVPAVCRHRVDLGSPLTSWPLAHPLFVALDLAQDADRGREILEAWTPAERWVRVW